MSWWWILIALWVGAIVGFFVAALCAAAARGDAHLEALERGGVHGSSNPPFSPRPSQVPVMKPTPLGEAVDAGSITKEEFTEALRKIGRPK